MGVKNFGYVPVSANNTIEMVECLACGTYHAIHQACPCHWLGQSNLDVEHEPIIEEMSLDGALGEIKKLVEGN